MRHSVRLAEQFSCLHQKQKIRIVFFLVTMTKCMLGALPSAAQVSDEETNYLGMKKRTLKTLLLSVTCILTVELGF